MALLVVAAMSNCGGEDDTGEGSNDGSGGSAAASRLPGTHHTTVSALPDGEPTACEQEWIIRFLHYHPGAVVPRRMYFSACNTDGAQPEMFVSLTFGQNVQHPDPDDSSGGVLRARLDSATGQYEIVDERRFPECEVMEGIATSSDCSIIGVLCRRPYGDSDYDFDSLATHSDADWMTQPDCAEQEMWLYEWTDGDLSTDPQKYVVHRAIGPDWDYGNNYLRLAEDDNTYGIGLKARVFGGGNCHEADAFLVLDRTDYAMTNRGWSWACGTGHTLFNRPAYNPATQKYAVMCGTDGSDAGSPLGGLWMHVEDGDANEFYYTNYEGLRIKGGSGTLLPLSDGGYLGVIVGVDATVTPQEEIPLEPPTSIGLVRFDSDGNLVGDIDWVVQSSHMYLSYPQLAPLGDGRYLLGYGEMYDLDAAGEMNDDAYRIPLAYYVLEIDQDGNRLTEAQLLEGAGWGEQDQMVSLGDGSVGWAYIPDPALVDVENPPDCNSNELQLSVYTSSEE